LDRRSGEHPERYDSGNSGIGSGAIRSRRIRYDGRAMLALSIRQPYVELILRGVKTIEYRSKPTRRIGERFYLYASKLPAENPEAWATTNVEPGDLPTGVIVGSAVIHRVTRGDDGLYEWHLTAVERARRLRKPMGRP